MDRSTRGHEIHDSWAYHFGVAALIACGRQSGGGGSEVDGGGGGARLRKVLARRLHSFSNLLIADRSGGRGGPRSYECEHPSSSVRAPSRRGGGGGSLRARLARAGSGQIPRRLVARPKRAPGRRSSLAVPAAPSGAHGCWPSRSRAADYCSRAEDDAGGCPLTRHEFPVSLESCVACSRSCFCALAPTS